jgi:thiol:disulfide interchange protein
LWLLHAAAGFAQSPPFNDVLGGLGGGVQDSNVVVPRAWFTPPRDGQPSLLFIEAAISGDWHIYSLTQPPGGPVATQIRLAPDEAYRPLAPFRALTEPKKHFDNVVFKLDVEEHHGKAVFYAPLEWSPDAELQQHTIRGAVRAQACREGTCLPPRDYAFTARLEDRVPEGYAPVGSSLGSYRHPRSHVTWRGYVEPRVAAAGDEVRIVLTAEPEEPYHLYALAARPSNQPGSRPTLIALTQVPPDWQAEPPQASASAVSDPAGDYYPGAVTFTLRVRVPAGAAAGSYGLRGVVGYQACIKDQTCDQPRGMWFDASVQVASSSQEDRQPLLLSDGKYAEAEQRFASPAATPPATATHSGGVELPWEPFSRQALDELTDFDPSQVNVVRFSTGPSTLWLALLTAFLGGLILNVMPCVLPVIGLKIMSFVQQAGESRARAFMLNVWFSLGLISVFMVLAALAVFAGLGWGQQFQSNTFNMVLASVVFVLALSMLGVWEIPIPGFVGSGKASELAAKEGAAGAFFKGVLTTVLATPCTGPFMGTALAWAVKQPPEVTFATFGALGLGMASPYLLAGAYPRLLAFLPKPGAWMDTFKQVMGFVLLGTVVWLMSFVDFADLVPLVALMFGLWLACWWAGRISPAADFHRKLRGWVVALGIAAAAVLISTGPLDQVMQDRFEARLQSYGRTAATSGQTPGASPAVRVAQPRPPGKHTLLVDFTADW